jgi:hypothetical protein
MEGQPKGVAWRNPAKPGFRHEVPEMRPNYMKNFCKSKTAVAEIVPLTYRWCAYRGNGTPPPPIRIRFHRQFTWEAESAISLGYMREAQQTAGVRTSLLKRQAARRIIKIMFKKTPCAAGCGNGAISGSELCGLHCAEPRKEAYRIASYILGQNTIRDLNAAHLRFEDNNFSSKQFYGCNFIESYFKNGLFSGSFMRMVFFDGSVFVDCDFSNSDLQFLSFGNCVFENCKFNDSELIHLNFNATSFSRSSFDHSNLYNSRFNMAKLEQTSIEDCNLKNVYFFNFEQTDVSFRYSNTKDAFFEMED